MTIRKFAEWGRLIDRPNAIELCNSDAEVAKVAIHHQSCGTLIPHIHVTGGSLAASLGNTLALSSTKVRELPIDLLHISYRTTSGMQRTSIAANSVLMRHRWWTGQIVVITNSGYLGTWEIAPRAHPNDGVFDVVEVATNMSIRQRLIAKQRLRHGTHTPHPSVSLRQCQSVSWNFAEPIGLYLDGEYVELTTQVHLTIEPDALNLVI